MQGVSVSKRCLSMVSKLSFSSYFGRLHHYIGGQLRYLDIYTHVHVEKKNKSEKKYFIYVNREKLSKYLSSSNLSILQKKVSKKVSKMLRDLLFVVVLVGGAGVVVVDGWMVWRRWA